MKRFISGKKLVLSGVVGLAVMSGAANAALDPNAVTAVQTEVLGDVALVAAAAIAIMTVVLGWDVGISLLKKFTKKGAS